MTDPSILSNLVAVIHDIRAEQIDNWTTDNVSAVEEVDAILSSLLTLESQLEQFDNLELVKHLKGLFTGLVTAANSQSDDSVDNISVNDAARKTVFDSIRKDSFDAISRAISNIENDEEALLQTSYASLKAFKKKRNDGYFTSFNFDDLPEYEHLESTLAVLRADLCSEIAIRKLLTMDQDELVEHPQWRELILLLRYSLYKGSESCIILSLHLHLKLANFLPDYQAIDAVLNMLNYFIDTWITDKSHDEMESSQTNSNFEGASNSLPFAKSEGEDATLDKLTSCQLTVFTALLLTVSERIVLPSMEGDGDRAIASIFLLFAHAVLPMNLNTVQGVHYENGKMMLIDAVALFTVEKGNFIMDIMRRRNPSAVVTHAVQSGLLGVLNQRLASATQDFSNVVEGGRAAEDTSCAPGCQSKAPALKRRITMRCLLYSKFMFSLLEPFLANAPLMEFCTRLLHPGVSKSSGCGVVDTSQAQSQVQYLWDTARSPRENARFRESWSTDVLRSVGNSVISLEANIEANKLICQLSGAKSLLEFFSDKESCSGSPEPVQGPSADSSDSCDRTADADALFGRMLIQLSINLKHFRESIRSDDALVKSRLGTNIVNEVTAGCPGTATVTSTAGMEGRGCSETSLLDLLRLLTAYAVRLSPPHPPAVHVPVHAFGSSSTTAECSSSSSSQRAVRDQVLSECASFCLGVRAIRASDTMGSCSQYTATFIAELKRSLVSAHSQRSSARAHRRSVLMSVTHCLVRVMDCLTPCTGSDRVDAASLSEILRAWTAVLGIIAFEGDGNSADAADGSFVSAVLNTEVQEAVMMLVNACLQVLGYGLDSSMMSCGIAVKENAVRSHPKRDPSQGSVSSSADSCSKSELGDRSSKIDKSDKDTITYGDSSNSNSADSDVKYDIIVFFLSALSSYGMLMPRTDPLTPSEDRCLNNMMSAVFSSLLSSCQYKQHMRDRAIETPSYTSSYSCSPQGDTDPSLSDKLSPQGCNTTTRVPVFHDVFPLVEALLGEEPRTFRTALRVISSAEYSKEIQQILHGIEVSSANMQGSECDISDAQLYSEHCTVTPFLYLLYRLARSSVLGADTVISMCGGTWDSLRELHQSAKTAFKRFEIQQGTGSIDGESSLPDTVGIAPRLLAYLHVSGDLGRLETDSTGGLLIQILYGALQHERTCEAAREYVLQLVSNPILEPTHTHACCAAAEIYKDLSEYFSSPVSAECSSSSTSESMQVEDTESSAAGLGMGMGMGAVTQELLPSSLSSYSPPRVPSDAGRLTYPRAGPGDRVWVPNGSDAPGWDLGSMFIAVLRYKLSSPLGCTQESSIPIPHTLIPSNEEELESIIAAVSSLTRKSVN